MDKVNNKLIFIPGRLERESTFQSVKFLPTKSILLCVLQVLDICDILHLFNIFCSWLHLLVCIYSADNQ